MNNFYGRLLFFIIVLLIIINMIFNHWIHKELAVKPEAPASETSQMTPSDSEESSEQSDVLFANEVNGLSVEEEVALRKTQKKERVPDEKIIYEMPTSNKILLQ